MTKDFQDQLAKAIGDAKEELKRKDLRKIQTDTAIKWLGRAVASVQMGRREEAHEYAHEALEHAALAERARLIDDVRSILKKVGVDP